MPIAPPVSAPESSSSSAGTAVVNGAGIVGRCCALALQRRGWEVRLLDDDPEHIAPSWGNAGHIAVEQIEPLASPASLRSAWRRSTWRGGPLAVREPWRLASWLSRFLRASSRERHAAGTQALTSLMAGAMPAWRQLAQSLSTESDRAQGGVSPVSRDDLDSSNHSIHAEAPLVHFGGHLACWPDADSAQRGRETLRAGVPDWIAVDAITDVLQRTLAEALPATPIHGCHLHGSAHIDDHARLRTAIDTAFVRAGGVRLYARAATISRDAGASQAHVVLADGRRLDADAIIVCTGVDAAELLQPLGTCVPLVAERGYHLHWTDHDWPASMPPVVFEDRSVVVTRFGNGLRMTSFVEFAPRTAAPVAARWDALARHARELGLPVRGDPQRWFGPRPTLPDYLPAIGRSRQAGNVLYAVGHQHLGLTLAPVTAELIADLAAGRKPSINLAPFDLARFG